MQLTDLRKGIVRILNPDGTTAGTGFIVSPQLIATCAHVVNVKYAEANPVPDISCKRLVDEQEFKARVEKKYWRNPENEDVAFLRVNDFFSDDIPLKLGTSVNIKDHSFESYGFPAKLSKGLQVTGTILSETTDGTRLQLKSTDIVEGVSGAPVIDQKTHLVVGMVCERTEPDVREESKTLSLKRGGEVFSGKMKFKTPTGRLENVAYAIPSRVLREICPELFIEYICPYLGLSAFTENEERFFFGQEKLKKQLFEKLLSGSEFLAIVGSSGSGKSSVVQAGLLPKLYRGDFQQFPKKLPIFKLRPSDDKNIPEKSLLAALFGVQDFELEKNGDVWEKIQKYLQQQSSRSIIFIDQFEELFALFSPDKQKVFIQGLYDLITAGSKVTLIITIRSDFYEPLNNSALSRFLPASQVNVQGVCEDEELRTIITKPAEQIGLNLEKGLVDLMLTDLKQTQNPLPLLEFTLQQLWNAENEKNLLTRECYLSERINRVTGAIAQWANATYRELPSETEKNLTRRIFTRLIQYGPSTSPKDNSPKDNSTNVPYTRRRVSLDELISSEKESPIVRRLIKKLADTRLLVTDTRTVEIIHDALITEWSELKRWIKEKRSFLFWRQRLDESFRTWRDNKENEGYLLYKAALGEAEGYLNNDEYRVELNKDERSYIKASVEKRDRQWERVIIGLSSFSAFVLCLAGLAGWQWRQAVIGEIEAGIGASEALLASDQKFDDLDALINSLKAGKKLKQSFILDAKLRNRVKGTLQKVVYGIHERDRLENNNNREIIKDFSVDGSRLTNLEQYGFVCYWDNLVCMWDKSDERIAEFLDPLKREAMKALGFLAEGVIFPDGTKMTYTFSPKNITFSPDGSKVVIVAKRDIEDYMVKSDTVATRNVTNIPLILGLWDLKSKKRLAEFIGYDDNVWSVAFSPDGSKIAIGGSEGIRLWDANGEEISEFRKGQGRIIALDFSPDGSKIAAVRSTRTFSGDKIEGDADVSLWDLNGQEIVRLKGDFSPYEVIFSPDGTRLATVASTTSDEYQTVRLWDLSGNQAGQFQGPYGSPIMFSPDGRLLAGTGVDGVPRLWDLDVVLGNRLFEFTGHRGEASVVSFSSDGKQWVTQGTDGTVRLWDLNDKSLAKYTEKNVLNLFFDQYSNISFGGLSFSPDSKTIATARDDGTIRLLDLSGNLLAEFKGPDGVYSSMIFSSDGNLLAANGADDIVYFWDIKNKRFQKTEAPKSLLHNSARHSDFLLHNKNEDGIVYLWNWEGELLAKFKDLKGELKSVNLKSNVNKLATVEEDGTVHLWNWEGKHLAQFKAFTDQFIAFRDDVIFSPDGSLLATSDNGSVQLWDLSGNQLAKFTVYPYGVISISFSPDGKLLAAAGLDGIPKLWDLESELQVAEFSAERSGQVRDIAFSPDGKLLAIVGNLGNIDFWQIESFDELMVRGCNWVRDYLENSPNIEDNDRYLCDGIGSANQ